MKHPDDLFISMCQNVTIDGLCFKYSCTRKDLEEFAIYHYGESLQNIYERSQKVVYSNLQARLYAFACSSDASPPLYGFNLESDAGIYEQVLARKPNLTN